MQSFLEFIPEELALIVQQCGSGLGIVLGAGLFYLLVARGLQSFHHQLHLPERLITTFQRIAFWFIFVSMCLILLQSLGILHSVIAAVTGVFALLAIGFVAVWSVLSNTLCSLILMIMRPYRVGDTLSLPPDDLEGTVVNFNLIFTTLETEDGSLLQIPNNLFFQRPLVRKKGNWRIGLADQLYETKNATGEPAPPESEATATQQAA